MKAKVLIVEDERIIARDLQARLKRMGYEVAAVVPSGEEAVRAISELCPELVLMDLVLEGPLDGVETAKRIREHCDIPVIFITAYGDQTTLERTQRVKPAGYILKPFEERELQATLERVLGKAAA